MDWGGGCITVMGMLAWGLRKSYKLGNLLVAHRPSMETISLSMHPNNTHLYIKQNHEHKTSTQTATRWQHTFRQGREGDPYPTCTY